MDNSFIELIKDENINRINIDPRLIASFKRVMHKIQEYFNANGYSGERDYTIFFEKYLLDGKFSIQLNDEPSKIGAAGFYSKNENRICIDIGYIDDEQLDSILCHEFIHFLVMHGLKFGKCATEIYQGGFINEALTEMLTQQIYPNSKAYIPQVTMLKYVNELAGKVNNYSLFLKGYIDGQGYGPSWRNFTNYVEEYQDKFKNIGFKLSEAMNDQNYIAGQWEVTNSFITLNSIKSIEDYIEKFKILTKRPVLDFDKFNKKINEMINALIANLGLKNHLEYSFLRKKLIQLSNDLLELSEYDGIDIYSFVLGDYKFDITESGNILNMIPGVQITKTNYSSVVNIKYKGEEINIDLTKIDFRARKKKLQNRIKAISSYFDKDSKDDLIAVSKMVNKDNLISLKKYILPQVGELGSKKPTIIYIAQYPDRIEILGDYYLIGIVDNIELNKYIGLTSHENGLICFDKVGNINDGCVFSILNSYQVNSACRAELIRHLKNCLPRETIQKLIESYKNSADYDESTSDLEFDAIYNYADDLLREMDEDTKKELIDSVVLERKKFVVSNSTNGVMVSMVFGDENMSSFIAEEQVLVDQNGLGLYNQLYSELKQHGNVGNIESESINLEYDNGLVFDKDNNINYRLYVLSYLQRNICREIEDLMKNKNSVNNFEYQLQQLLNMRDNYQNKIDEILNANKKVM